MSTKDDDDPFAIMTDDDDDREYRKAWLEQSRQDSLRQDSYFDEDEDMPDDFDPDKQSFVDYNFVADYGWDPLKLSRFDFNLGGISSDSGRPLQVVIRDYREAELRHGRLAMLASLAWPVQELLSPTLSRALRAPMLMAETGGRSPSVLNGGLEQSTIPYTLAAFAALNAAVDLYSLKLRGEVCRRSGSNPRTRDTLCSSLGRVLSALSPRWFHSC